MTDHPFVNELTPTISIGNFWDIILPLVPLVGAMVIFSFGYHVVKHVIRGASRGQASIGADEPDEEFDRLVAEVEAENGEYSDYTDDDWADSDRDTEYWRY